MDGEDTVRNFVLDFLAEIGADVRHEGGVYTVAFPLGYKRQFGRERRFTFDPENRVEQVELVEAGSPLLKMLVTEAKKWGPLGMLATPEWPAGTMVYTFQFDAYSSIRKRSQFAHAVLGTDGSIQVRPGVPAFFETGPTPVPADRDFVGRLKEGLDRVRAPVEHAGRAFSREAVKESEDSFRKSVERVAEYFHGVKHETYLEEARIRRRLGEIQSKLYFTEDGIRERKLQQEQERLTQELHALKKKNTQASEVITSEREAQAEKQRRLHEPKLRMRLVAATAIRPPPPPPKASPKQATLAPEVPPPVPAQPSAAPTPVESAQPNPETVVA